MNPVLIIKPFPSYRWQWGASTPTESLNIPSIFFGCLEVLHKNEGKNVNSEEVYQDLLIVEKDLGVVKPKLARTPVRNLFRNSGQYWKNLGLIEATSPKIKLTSFGKAYINGGITKSEFSCQVIKSLTFPNRISDRQNVQREWDDSDLKIKPLEFILEVILAMYNSSADDGYLTGREMTKVVIPLAGNRFSPLDTADVLLDYRRDNTIMIGAWDAEKESNDHRIAREFLLFLLYYGFLKMRAFKTPKGNEHQEFYLEESNVSAIKALLDIDFELIASKNDKVSSSIIIDKQVRIADVIRERKTIEILSRPNQAKFRKSVMGAGGGVCVLSGVATPEVIQACHVIQVKDGGSDDVANGLLLRVDLHTLYDKGHIRILEDGTVKLSAYLNVDPFYGKTIPAKVEIPAYVSSDALRMRNTYNMY